jgi:hypothetical protein
MIMVPNRAEVAKTRREEKRAKEAAESEGSEAPAGE